MKALTICQPYAHLICVTKEKGVENRTWPTRYRGALLIHAGKSRDWLDIEDGEDVDYEYGIPLADMTFGAVIGAATLHDCLHVEAIRRGDYDARIPWLKTHEHTEGPWCWVLTNRVMFPQPVPYKGQQGLFDIPDEVVVEQITAVRAARAAA